MAASQANKPHKAHKVAPKESSGKPGKAVRTQRCQKKKTTSGSGVPPRVIVLFGLSAAADLNSLEGDLLHALSPSQRNGPTIASPEHELRASILKAPHGNLSVCMEMAKVADLIAFVATASRKDDSYIDAFGSQCLSVFRAIGLPRTAVLIRNQNHDMKKKPYISSIASEFPQDCKFYPADTKDELHTFIRLFKYQRLTIPSWRTQRPYLLVEKVDLVDEDCTSGKCTLLLTGYLRARSVHVSGAGDFQLSKIDLLKDPCPLSVRKTADSMDLDDSITQVIRSIIPDPMKQEPLQCENIPDPLTAEQTWPTDAEMAEADRNHYDDDCSNTNDNDMVLEGTENGFPGDDFEPEDDKEFDDKTDTDSDGENLNKDQIEEEIRRIKKAHAEDEEFPDEKDTLIDVPARRRFAKYRGLKSLRTSSWDQKESLPADYGRIFAFDNYNRIKKHVLAKAEEWEHGDSDECLQTGSYARLYIKDVPNVVASKLSDLAKKKTPIVSCGLLQHESKISVLHFSVKKHNTYTAPLKSKEELTFHVGFRQFVARFLHPGGFSKASVYAPICFPLPQLPLVAVKNGDELASPVVAAVGSVESVDPDRIILKKIILTGYPQRVSRSKATVRLMFHNPEDVKWFKPVELRSKRGLRGRVKEPLGTHGAMKCIFNATIQQHDTVCMSLYKRSYPKWPSQWFPLAE